VVVHEGVGLVTELSRRFGAGDRDGAMALLHPDLEIEQPASLPHGGVHRGHAGMADMGRTFSRSWTRTIESPRIIGCDDGTVVQITTQTWTALGSGRSATVDVVELFTFADGRIVGIRVFQQDTHLLMTTLDPGAV
jgi:uncharacterized protein